MPYARPGLTDLRNQAISDITTSNVPGLAGLLRNAVLRVLAFVTAGLAYLLYGYLDYIAHQAVPFTATDEYLEAWAALKGVYRKDATGAIGQALFTGNTTGTVLANGASMTRVDGVAFVTTAVGTVDGSGNLLVPIASTDVGEDTNCVDGTPIGIDSPIPGINSGGVTSGPMTGGADQETDDELRTRMLAAYANPPQGGSQADYIEWATSVPGCTRAWIVPGGMGAGTVSVYPMFDDNAYGGFPQGTNGCASEEARGPTAIGDQLAVAEYIWPRQPIPALVYVIAPVAFHIPVTLYNFAPNDSDVIAQVSLSLTDMFTARASIGGTIYPSDVAEAVSATPGVDHFTLYYPTTPMTAPAGALPTLGTFIATP